ncbi:hypothetical protein DFH06DRAFT_1341135 [Mycena polygramma]|nr:hypothetical protein DFH06DRAFT_1341135 [Mycena polygramma]
MSSAPALPPGVTLLALIRPSLNLLIIGTVWAAALVPLLCVLLFFSTAQIRRQPIFIMNLFAVVMGIVVGAINLELFVSDILSPPGEGFKPRVQLAYLGMILFLPLFIDCILAFRLYVVYPPRTTSRLQLAIIFIPILVLKIARTTNLILFMVKFAAALLVPDTKNAVGYLQILWDHAPWTKIEWILQVFDNCYASGLFLWKIQLGRRKAQAASIVNSGSSSSSADKLKSLFFLALSSFMFPCMFSIAQIILTFHNHDFFLGAYVFVNNLYIEIIGVLLATIWASKSRYEGRAGNTKTSTQLSSIRLGYGIGGSGIKIKSETTHDMSTAIGSSGSRGGDSDLELEEFNRTARLQQFDTVSKSRDLGQEISAVADV